MLTSSERVDALPSTDEALAARLQGDWKNASAQERDELLRGCDEMEARRAAPPQFLDMVTRLRAGAKGDAEPSTVIECGQRILPEFIRRASDTVESCGPEPVVRGRGCREPALDGGPAVTALSAGFGVLGGGWVGAAS